ncbi:MAG TPA: GNAT family N-acetyltransferase [Gaiellaceae bacterium]
MIQTERLVLRKPRLEDADQLAAIFAEEETMRFVGGTVSADETCARIERMAARWDRDGFGQLLAERRDDGRIAGRFGIFTWATDDWDTTEDLTRPYELELGWLLGRDFHGFGYATEAAGAVRDWTIRTLSPPRLISLVNIDNVASAAVARRLGCRSAGRVETLRFGLSEVWVHGHQD